MSAKKCNCNHSGVSIVRGNDVTVEAAVTVYDSATEGYSPLDLSGASDVSLNMVGPFGRVAGRGVSAVGSKISAFFPAGSLGVGMYGVEITFRDSGGRSRLFERGLVRVVESGGEADGGISAAGKTVSVDVRTRVITLGGVPIVILDEADYAALDRKDPWTLYVIRGGSDED